jgi:hypothetical protein
MIAWAIIAGKKGNYWQARQVAVWQGTLLSSLKNHCLASGEIVWMFNAFIKDGLRTCGSKLFKACLKHHWKLDSHYNTQNSRALCDLLC